MNSIEVDFLRNSIQSIQINISSTKRNLDDMIDSMRKMEKELEDKKQMLLRHESIEDGKKVCQFLQCKDCSVCHDSLLETIVGRSIIHYKCKCNNGNIVHVKCFIPLLKGDGSRCCPLCREHVTLSKEDVELYSFIDRLNNCDTPRTNPANGPNNSPRGDIQRNTQRNTPNITVLDTVRVRLPSLPHQSSSSSVSEDEYIIQNVM